MRRKVVVLGACLVALVLPAACGGSELSPQDVLEANRAVSGQAEGSTTGGTTDGTVPGAEPGTDPGTATDPGAGTGATTGGGGGGTTGTTGGTGGAAGGGGGAAVAAGSCAGFKNQTGITDKTITIGNAADLSGPVPGLFTAAQEATRAYVAYFNATNDICGRKLELITADSRTDAGADQQAYQKFCEQTFASVGSMSAFDSGGAGVAGKCGLPDMRAASVTATRNACASCFGAQATGPHEYSNEAYDFYVRNFPTAVKKGAFLYLNAGAAAENAMTQIAVGKKRGVNWLYTAPVDVAEFNYGPYVQQMKSKGVEFVQFIGAYQQSVRLAQAMQSGGFKPQVLSYDPSVYDQNFIKTGGSAVEGAVLFVNFTPLDERQAEIDLYRKWLGQVAPGAEPTFFGLFAWSAAKLFVEQSLELGGKLTRASLVQQIRGINKWTGGGSHGPMQVGAKHPPSCLRFLTVKGGKFVAFKGSKYRCAGYSKA